MKYFHSGKIAIISGVIISASLFIVTFNYEVEKQRLHFLSSASNIFNKVETTFSALNRVNTEFASRFYLADELKKDEFFFFAQSHIAHTPFIEEILFSEKVLRTDKKQYESNIQNEGYSGFKIKPFSKENADSSIHPKTLFPIKYIEPYNVKNSRWFGLDIFTHSSLNKAIQSTTDHPGLLTYTHITGETNKLYAIRALYSGDYEHAKNKDLKDIFGILLYKINLQNIVDEKDPYSIEISINGQQVLKKIIPDPDTLLYTTFNTGMDVLLADQKIRVNVWQKNNLLSSNLTFPLIMLLLGLTFTLFVWHIIYSHIKINKLLSKQKDIIESEVQEKTGELKNKADELTTAYNRQLELTDELEAFCYSVSHDLKAPLRSINGFSQILHDDYSNILDDEAKNYLSRTSAAAGKMGEIIDDLLSLSRISRSRLKTQNVNISDIAKRSAQIMQEYQPDREVSINIQKDITATGNPKLLQIAIDNLMSNAWKYSEKNTDAHIEFGMTSKNNRNIYYIRDNGVGFDMQYKNKLFIAFQRLHHPTQFEGTGIGLATVQRIIQKHNGRIWANSEIGKGSTFYFTLGDRPKRSA